MKNTLFSNVKGLAAAATMNNNKYFSVNLKKSITLQICLSVFLIELLEVYILR